MKENVYNVVPQVDGEAPGQESFVLLRALNTSGLSATWPRVCCISILSLLLSTSLLANIYFLHRQYFRPWDLATELPTRYAKLQRNIPTRHVAHDVFDSMNRTAQDAAWEHWTMEPWLHFVALDEEYTKQVDLPHAQRWPWDNSKGTYILTVAHELHCVRILRMSINEAHDNVANQTWPHEHLIHCLNLLRKTVMCNADDTPLYTGLLHANAKSEHPNAGIGSIRMCRDWDALLRWSRERSACYRPEKDHTEIERYRYCPDGSRPWEKNQRAVSSPDSPRNLHADGLNK